MKYYKTEKDLKEAVDNLKEIYRWEKFVKEWEKRNLIPFENFFKYSGRVEEDKPLIEHYRYKGNRIEKITEYFDKLKKDKNGKTNKNND